MGVGKIHVDNALENLYITQVRIVRAWKKLFSIDKKRKNKEERLK